MLGSFANLPRPVQAVVMLASGASLTSFVLAAVPGPYQSFFIYVTIGIVAVVVLMALFKLVLMLRDKAKSGPFASMLSKGARGAADPALKARMDDLRRKFEEGVTTFKQAGKDLYSLPWYLLVGPPGSGKTEALRHSNVGFPPGLQDPLQGSGGTLNMHWWFTNHAVVIDTAGRMFMEGADEGGGSEWREFLKLLKSARPNCPVNGLLLVISSESLLKDGAEKIEQTAGAIARQLDVVQRTLDVRFPVTVVVTKCDKIIGFREFFEHIGDPNLQHQILGWSNPSPLDEAFKPDQVDKHLESVRQKLMKRRMGLIQNPVHTTDANARRTDQIDEMFELPDNLVRIAPRLRRYLEMIFVAGEWSPKPLFLRGIYFTSSMREGQALDVSLAQALGVDVESIPGSRDWDREKSYFLRDLFMSKVFKEKGLVTRATNVSKALAKQRALLVGGAIATAVVLGGLTVLGYFQFNASLGPPSKTWSAVRGAMVGDPQRDVTPLDPKETSLIARSTDAGGTGWVYQGRKDFTNLDVLGSDIVNPLELIVETGSYKAIDPPLIARPAAPMLGFRNSFLDSQEAAHRRVIEQTTVSPLLEAARSRLEQEKDWGPDAVAALAQLIRVQTYSYKSKPAFDEGPSLADLKDAAKEARLPTDRGEIPAIDVDALFRYVLGPAADEPKGYAGDRSKVRDAVKRAYPNGLGAIELSGLLGGKDETNRRVNERAAANLAERMRTGGSPTGDMGALLMLQSGLAEFAAAEAQLRAHPMLRAGATGAAGLPRTVEQYDTFAKDASAQFKRLADAKAKVDQAVTRLGSKADNPLDALTAAGEQWEREAGSFFDQLIQQLPKGLDTGLEGKAAELAEKAFNERTPEELRSLLTKLVEHRKSVVAAVKASLETVRADMQRSAPLAVPGRTSAQVDARAYAARYALYELGSGELTAASQPVGAVTSVTAKIDQIDAGPRRVGEQAQAWLSWTPAQAGLKGLAPDQVASLTTDRDEAERLARRVSEIAGARRVYEAIRQAIADWPKDVPALRERVKALADAKIEGGVRRVERPRLLLTEMKDGGEFDRVYFVEAGREVMGDWARVRTLIEPASGAERQVMDAEALRGGGYLAAGRVTEDYVVEYARYWRRQATDATQVSVNTWADFAGQIDDMIPDNIVDLKQLQDVTTAALDSIPSVLMAPAALSDHKADVAKAFSGLATEAFSREGAIRDSLRNWRRLAGVQGGPEGAVGLLRASYNAGDAQAEYFAQYGKGVAYWDGVVLRGVELLTEATQGDIARAQNLLMSSNKAPLCFGPASMGDLSPDELRAVAAAASKVASGSGGTGTAVKPSAGMDPRVNDLLSRLFGANFIKATAERQTWFTRLQRVLDSVAGKDPVHLNLNLLSDAPPQGAAGKVLAADSGYKFAALYVNDKKVGEAFNIFSASTIPADKAKDLVVTLPAQSSFIGLYREDPGRTDRAPDERIALPEHWSLLGAMLKQEHSDRVGPGVWRVMASNNTMYLWLTIKIEPDVPARADWPSVGTWPGQ